jgi:hypothetical protein
MTMGPTLRAIARLLFGGKPPARMLDGFVDSLVQTFENCRPGLSDEVLRQDGAAIEPFFRNLYEKERPRLRELVRLQEAHLSETARKDLLAKVEARIKDVLIPAYTRLARKFTGRERNDFYLTSWHTAERIGLVAGGILLGVFIAWARFLPLWFKEGTLLLAAAGLVFPELRRVLAMKRYQSDLNELVIRTDDEIFRMDVALLTLGPTAVAQDVASVPEAPEKDTTPGAPRRLREGGR